MSWSGAGRLQCDRERCMKLRLAAAKRPGELRARVFAMLLRIVSIAAGALAVLLVPPRVAVVARPAHSECSASPPSDAPLAQTP